MILASPSNIMTKFQKHTNTITTSSNRTKPIQIITTTIIITKCRQPSPKTTKCLLSTIHSNFSSKRLGTKTHRKPWRPTQTEQRSPTIYWTNKHLRQKWNMRKSNTGSKHLRLWVARVHEDSKMTTIRSVYRTLLSWMISSWVAQSSSDKWSNTLWVAKILRASLRYKDDTMSFCNLINPWMKDGLVAMSQPFLRSSWLAIRTMDLSKRGDHCSNDSWESAQNMIFLLSVVNLRLLHGRAQMRLKLCKTCHLWHPQWFLRSTSWTSQR